MPQPTPSFHKAQQNAYLEQSGCNVVCEVEESHVHEVFPSLPAIAHFQMVTGGWIALWITNTEEDVSHHSSAWAWAGGQDRHRVLTRATRATCKLTRLTIVWLIVHIRRGKTKAPFRRSHPSTWLTAVSWVSPRSKLIGSLAAAKKTGDSEFQIHRAVSTSKRSQQSWQRMVFEVYSFDFEHFCRIRDTNFNSVW